MTFKVWITGIYHKHTKQTVAPVEVKHDATVHDYHGGAIESALTAPVVKHTAVIRDYPIVDIVPDGSELYDEMLQARRKEVQPEIDRVRLRETAWPHDLKPITARVWAKLPPNKRAYILKTLPSVGRA
jgi:hypothetical protein